MGQSASEPRWDTTAGKFGPFAGQLFVGDQTKSMVMRVVLEKVNGHYQRVHSVPQRLPMRHQPIGLRPRRQALRRRDERGWGSVGSRPQGLQRLDYTGVMPFEIHAVKLTHDGFDLTFTKPLAVESAKARSVPTASRRTLTIIGVPTVRRR